MTANWNEVTLGDICNFSSGKAIAPNGSGPYPAYGSNGLIGQSEKSLFPSGVIIGRVGAYCGSVAYSKKPFWASDNTIVARPVEDKLDQHFSYYLLLSANLNSWAGGAAQPLLTQSVLKPLRFLIPPLSEQRRIASILGTYDDLIEVNRRRIALLEEMARRLFEEWFVRFRFPGHQGHPMVETAEGPLPEGWRLRQISELTSYLSRGLAPKYDETATTLVISQKCIRDQRLSLAPARRQSKPVPADKLVQLGDVLVNSTGVGTLGRVAQVEEILEGLTVDTHVTIVRPAAHVDRDFFGLALLRMEPLFERLGAGATGQTELGRTRIAAVGLVEPPWDLQANFGRHVRPVRELGFRLAQQNEVLAKSRDLLLPRLISGELSVSVAQRELEAA